MRTRIAIAGPAGALVVALLAGCAKPVPADRNMFVGEWRAPDMYLLVLQEGRVKYARKQGSGKTTVEGPLQGFDGDDFTVGVWFMATTFDVQEPPHEVDGTLRMTVDGIELTRIGDGSQPLPENEI